ncbi:unnamed protein product [Oppiella nova]|uniref:acid phosphatase n=1 Tax=Oppiella nova TaxID=334625 RepID=A0A7R9M1H9_9ACAR|nr:unnamed protein product [Oppiella nova]CAG2169032.1 unnamed protein product [Oppiella nova]
MNIAFYKNDPYKQEKWVDGLGELTPRGKHRMYTFGQLLRQRYGDTFLGDSPKNMQIRSSSSDRCLESASALATGLYPPKNRWIWSEKDAIAQLWQPIAIQTVLKAEDGLLVPNSDCPAADAAYQEIMHSKPVTDLLEKNKDFIKQINEKTGENYKTLRDLDYLYDTINHEMNFDEPKPAPKWVQELGNDTLDRLKNFESNAFKYDWSSKKVQRLRGGVMFNELTTKMVDASIKTPTVKVYDYSTHDTLLVTLLEALGLYSGDPPSYGAALLFELHQIDGQYFVHLFYANVTPVLTYTKLELKTCLLNETQSECKLNNFAESVKEFSITQKDWVKECQEKGDGKSYSLNRSQSDDKESSSSESSWFNFQHSLLVVVGVVVGVVLTALAFFANRNNETKTNEDNHQEVVIDSQPTSCLNEPKLSEEEELATLGLRPNTVSPDPCDCFGCVFCVNLCFMPPHTAHNGTTSGPDVKNNENKTNEDNRQEVVIDSQPTSCQNKPKLSEEEELAALGLRPNTSAPDPCACFGCVFCMNVCFVPTITAPPVPTHFRKGHSGRGFHDNDGHDGDYSDTGDFDWAVTFADNITGGDGGNGGHHGGDGGDGGGGDGGGDGGGGGGGDGGGGE